MAFDDGRCDPYSQCRFGNIIVWPCFVSRQLGNNGEREKKKGLSLRVSKEKKKEHLLGKRECGLYSYYTVFVFSAEVGKAKPFIGVFFFYDMTS